MSSKIKVDVASNWGAKEVQHKIQEILKALDAIEARERIRIKLGDKANTEAGKILWDLGD